MEWFCVNSRYLKKEERDSIFFNLTQVQQDFLNHILRRGKRTVFANVLAREEGKRVTEDMTIDEIEALLSDWMLIDVIDAGPEYMTIDEPLTCECGRTIRYQYVVKHMKSGEQRYFGITHFEEHMQIPAQAVRDLIKGFQKIDYELDELLSKYRDGWKLGIVIPEDFEVPTDIKAHLDVSLPLLDRQINRLQERIHAFLYTATKVDEFTHYRKPNSRPVFRTTSGCQLDEKIKSAIANYLHHGVQSALEISEMLIKHNGVPNERMVSGRPLIYSAVCLYIDQELKCTLLHGDFKDRHYSYNKD